MQKAEQEESGSGAFDGGIAPGYGATAGPAAALEKDPAEEGDVVGGSDGRAAAGAAGAGADDGFVARQACDADVEEAAEGEPEEDDEDGDEDERGLAP